MKVHAKIGGVDELAGALLAGVLVAMGGCGVETTVIAEAEPRRTNLLVVSPCGVVTTWIPPISIPAQDGQAD